jgi:hypothetical protein
MKNVASRCSLLAIGLLVCVAEPSHAAPARFDTAAMQGLVAQAQRDILTPVAEKQVVPADDLNEIDRAAQEQTSPAPPVAVPSNEEQKRRTTVAMASSDHSVWDETSLIGKIFIGLGTLLTLASAARMFMA